MSYGQTYTVTATVTRGSESKSATGTIIINNSSLSIATVSQIADQTYTGNAITVSPTVSFEGTILNESTDYTLSFANNINAGTASLTITGIGNYSGTKTVSFTIVQAAPTIIFNDVTKTYGDADFNLSATSSSTGAYTYSIADPAVATLTGSTTTIVGVGSTIVTVTQAAQGNYSSATATMTLTIRPPLNLVTSIPATASNTVAIDSEIILTFDTPVMPSTVNANNIVITGINTGIISGTYSGGGTTSVVFNPTNDFKPGEVITVTLTAALKTPRMLL